MPAQIVDQNYIEQVVSDFDTVGEFIRKLQGYLFDGHAASLQGWIGD